jgi:hypothetical protein
MHTLSTQPGKLCLEDEALAKKCIAAFAKELETSDSPVVRNNVMVRLPLSLSLSLSLMPSWAKTQAHMRVWCGRA